MMTCSGSHILWSVNVWMKNDHAMTLQEHELILIDEDEDDDDRRKMQNGSKMSACFSM